MPPLSSAAPAYIPMKAAPWISPPAAPGFTATYVCRMPPPAAAELCPPAWPLNLAPPPPLAPLPCWTTIPPPQMRPACVPAMHGAFHGAGTVAPPPHGAAAALSRPAARSRSACPPRLLNARRRKQQRAAAGPAPAPAPAAPPRGVVKAGDAKEEAEAAAANQPSPRSVLAAAAATSPPISPTTSLPTSFPYQVVGPAPSPPPAARVSGPAAALRAPRRPRRRARRPASGVHVRRRTGPNKPRRMFDPTSERTSLMIRNIPNDFTRVRMMNILDEHCFIENEKVAPGGVRSEFDFLYLPIDFRSGANKGYAFVNMTSPEAARRLWEHLNGHRWAIKGSAKTCAVDYADREGRDEFVEHFAGSCFDCHTEEYLPVWFEPPRDGTRPAEGAMHVVGRLARPSGE